MQTLPALLAFAALAAPLAAQQPAAPAAPQPAATTASVQTTAIAWQGLMRQVHAIATSAQTPEARIAALESLRPLALALGQDVRQHGKFKVMAAGLPLMPTEQWEALYDDLARAVEHEPALFLAVEGILNAMEGEPAPQAEAAAPSDSRRAAHDAVDLLLDACHIVAENKGQDTTVRELRALEPRARELGRLLRDKARPHLEQAADSLRAGVDGARSKGEEWSQAAEPHVQQAREWGHALREAAEPRLRRAADALLQEIDKGRLPSEEEAAATLIRALLGGDSTPESSATPDKN